MLTDKTVKDLLAAFSAPDPTPGGGSASALSGALGASLLAMVSSMPKTRTGSADERQALDAAHADLVTLRTALVDLIDRDAAAYDLVVAAMRRPKSTEDEKAARRAAIQDATRTATEVPLETMRACQGVITLGQLVAEHGNRSAASDIGVGLRCAMTGLHGARLNVEINLGGLTDEAWVRRIRDEIASREASARADFDAAHRSAGLAP